MHLRIRTLVLAAAAGLAAMAAPTARADFQLFFEDSAGGSATAIDGGLNDLDGLVNGVIQVNVEAVNAELTSFQFSGSLGATSNYLASPLSVGDVAELTVTGLAQRIAGTAGTTTLSILANSTDYEFASDGPLGNLLSSTGGTFSNTNGGSGRTFTGYYDATNEDLTGPPPVGTPGTPLSQAFGGTGSFGIDALDGVGSVAGVFALSSLTEITLNATTNAVNPPSDQFTSTVQLSVVPEPASMLMVGLGLPVAALVAARTRKANRARA